MTRLCRLLAFIFALLFSRVSTQAVLLEYRLLEERPGGALVADLIRDAGLDRRYDAGDLDQLRFVFLRRDARSDYFVVRNGTGELRTTRRIDREVICAGAATGDCDAVIRLDIAVQPLRFFQLLRVTVRIDDVNDNAPQFASRRQVVTISESAAVGSRVALPSARDPDAGSNGVRAYRLADVPAEAGVPATGEVFALHVSPDASAVSLVLRRPLDRETTPAYHVRLVAIDGGLPPRSATVDVRVEVTDANDNAPSFDEPSYSVDVNESAPVGSVVAAVHATDPDSGDNGRVTYRLAAETGGAAEFDVNATTGEVYLRGRIDYERRAMYRLSVVAEDGGHEPLSAVVVVTVRVRDVNDHAPLISVNALTSSRRVELREGAPPGTFVAHVSVTDPDGGAGGRVTCSLRDVSAGDVGGGDGGGVSNSGGGDGDVSGGDVRGGGGGRDGGGYFALRRLYATEFKVVSTATLDREARAAYDVRLTCRDGGRPPRQATHLMTVTVTDVNDHCPVFARDHRRVTVREDAPVGSFVSSVVATDADVDDNALVTYSVHPGPSPVVVVGARTGIVTIQRGLDYETTHSHEIRIVASDSGSPACSVTMTLTLDVVDVNDEAPVFRVASYNFATFENQAGGVEVGTVRADDRDGPPYDVISYSLDWPGSETFAVGVRTGVITAVRSLDRERLDVHRLTVWADNGPGSRRGRANVTVHVADRNDNAPDVRFPTDADSAVEVSSRAAVGEIVGQIEAVDVDIGENARLGYVVTGGSGADAFAVDAATGEISPRRSLRTGADQLYRLNVAVFDHGSPSLQSVVYLNVFVNASLAAAGGGGASAGSGLGLVGGSGAALVIIVVATLGVCVAVFVFALVVAWRRHRRRRKRALAGNVYVCRVETAREVTAGGGGPGAGGRRGEGGQEASWKEDARCAQHRPHLQFETPPSGGNCQCKKGARKDGWPPAFDMNVLQNSPTNSQVLAPTSVFAPERPSAAGEAAACLVAPPGDQPLNYMDEARRRLLYSTPQKTLTVPPPSYGQYQVQRGQRAHESDSDLDSQTDSGRGLSEEGEGAAAHLRGTTAQPPPRGSTDGHSAPHARHKYSKAPAKKSCLKPPPRAPQSDYDAVPLSPSRPPLWRHLVERPCAAAASRLRFMDTPTRVTSPPSDALGDCVRDVVDVYLSGGGGGDGGGGETAAAGAVTSAAEADSDSDDSSATSGSYIVDGADDCVVAIQRDIFV